MTHSVTDPASPALRKPTPLDLALAESGLVLRELVDVLPHMIWFAALDGTCTFLSKAWEDYTGVELAEQLGNGWSARLHDADRGEVLASWQRARAAGSDFQIDCRIRGSDGSYRWFELRGVPLRDALGRVESWFATATDVNDGYETSRQLAEQEERLRYVVLATYDSVYDWDARAGLTYRNEQYQTRFGAPAVAKDAEQWWNRRVHPDDRQAAIDNAQVAFAAHRDMWDMQYRLRRHDGAYAYVSDRSYLMYDGDGNLVRMIGAIADETEYHEAEQSLRDAQTRLLTAMQAGGLGPWIWDISADAFYWDESTYRLWGRSPDPRGKLDLETIRSFIHPDDAGRIGDSVARFYRAGSEYRTTVGTLPEFRVARPDGALQWILAKGQIERDDSGRPIRMAGVYIDITERKLIEQALRDSEGRLRSAMEAAGLATWIWDIRTNNIHWDEATCRLWGRGADEFRVLRPEQVWGMMHPDDRKVLGRALPQLMTTGIPRPMEFRTQRPDGVLQWLFVKGQIHHDADGQPVRMVGVFVDITDRKRREEALLQSQKMEALGTLAGGIAHDFNNILLAITGNAKLALTDSQPAQTSVRRSLSEIERAASRAADLVNRILTFSRQQEARHEVFLLQPLIEDALRLLRPTLSTTIDIRAALGGAAPVTGEAIQIQQVVMNLVTNAAHAIGDRSGAIWIDVCDCELREDTVTATGELAAGCYVRLTVGDTGGGIDAAVIDRIFEPFFTTKRLGHGTGLGLAVVHGIVQTYGGGIVVDNRSGEGTTFHVYLPAASGDLTPETVKVQMPTSLGGEHVLYVDDEEALVFLISRVLERMGYRVTGYLDPREALQALRADPEKFDVVVTDLSMRGMNGFELTRAIKTIRPDMPVLLTSGYLRHEDREAAAQLGIREMILKPNTVEELGQAIARSVAELDAQH